MKPKQRMKFFKNEIDFSRAIIEMTQEVIVLLDTEGRIMDCNVFLEKLSGYTAAEIIGRNWHDTLVFMGGTAVAEGNSPKSSASQRIPRTEVYRLLSQSGDPLYLEFSFRVIKDDKGEFCGVLVVGYDVTGRVEHEKSLEEERFDLIEQNKELTCLYQIARLANDEEIELPDLLQSISELIPDALQFADIAGASIRLDQQTFNSAGYHPSELQILEPITIQGVKRGDLEIVYRQAQEVRANDTIEFLAEEHHLAQAVVRNLTLIIEKREGHARKLELEQQLRHAERLATIGQLAAGIAHELNNPLGDILGFAQLSANHPDLPEEIYQDIVKIVKSSLYAREVIKKILLFSRQSFPHEREVNLNKLIEEWVDFFEFRCKQNHIKINLAMDPKLPPISADPSQLNQVLINLVVNAIHAMPDGGRLTIKTRLAEDRIYLEVQDTGTGIEEEIREKIFLPFYTTKDVDQGTGLGLAVVYGIVQEHGGQITFSSRMGAGTTFKIEFPVICD